ncbi:MAG: DUF3325 family protein [Candidatus Accumulibacter sp.]|jgi:predicted alpha/beta superfamily hydrolase|nr:DUF3325 family protein [Accumulibacter sp.]
MKLIPDVLIFALASIGFGALSTSMERHAKQIFGQLPPAATRRLRAAAGWLALALALVPAIHAYGIATGIAVWLGFLAVAATAIALLLSYRPRTLSLTPVPSAVAYVLLVALTAWFALPAQAQPNLQVRADTSLLTNESIGYAFATLEHPRAEGGRYRVYLATPRQAPPPTGYPVLYLLDGNAALDALKTQTEVLERLGASSSPPVLVMIGYDTAARFDVIARAYDYTPPIPGQAGLEDRPGSGRKAGGAEIFRRFMIERLRPEIGQKIRVDPQRQSLWGHSYGGLFVLHTLFAHPDDFQHYIAVSPTLWWQDGWISRVAETFAARPLARPATLLVVAGADEAGEKARRNPASPQHPFAAKDSLPRLIAQLNAKDGLAARLILLEGQTHGEMFSLGLGLALSGATGESF